MSDYQDPMPDKNCPQCKGQGFFFRLPSGMNPFAASIEVTAANMRRISCWCMDTEDDANERADNGRNTGGRSYL